MDFGSSQCLPWTISGSTSGSTGLQTPSFDPYGVVVTAEISLGGVTSTALDELSVRVVFYNDVATSVATVLQLSPVQVSVTGHSFSRRLSSPSRALSGGGGLKVTFTVTHIIDDPDEESSVNGLVASTKTKLNAAVSGGTGALDVALSYNMGQSGLSSNADFAEVDTEGVAFESGYEINNDKEFLMSLSAASGGGAGIGALVAAMACAGAALGLLM